MINTALIDSDVSGAVVAVMVVTVMLNRSITVNHRSGKWHLLDDFMLIAAHANRGENLNTGSNP